MSHDKIHFSFKEKKKKKLLINEYLSTGGGLHPHLCFHWKVIHHPWPESSSPGMELFSPDTKGVRSPVIPHIYRKPS